jgi:hypothetical protein
LGEGGHGRSFKSKKSKVKSKNGGGEGICWLVLRKVFSQKMQKRGWLTDLTDLHGSLVEKFTMYKYALHKAYCIVVNQSKGLRQAEEEKVTIWHIGDMLLSFASRCAALTPRRTWRECMECGYERGFIERCDVCAVAKP